MKTQKECFLIFSDGESIEVQSCVTKEDAYEKMKKCYEDSYPTDQESEWADMSYLADDSALLYMNGGGSCCWKIYTL